MEYRGALGRKKMKWSCFFKIGVEWMDVFEKKEWGLKKMKWSSPNILIVKK